MLFDIPRWMVMQSGWNREKNSHSNSESPMQNSLQPCNMATHKQLIFWLFPSTCKNNSKSTKWCCHQCRARCLAQWDQWTRWTWTRWTAWGWSKFFKRLTMSLLSNAQSREAKHDLLKEDIINKILIISKISSTKVLRAKQFLSILLMGNLELKLKKCRRWSPRSTGTEDTNRKRSRNSSNSRWTNPLSSWRWSIPSSVSLIPMTRSSRRTSLRTLSMKKTRKRGRPMLFGSRILNKHQTICIWKITMRGAPSSRNLFLRMRRLKNHFSSTVPKSI